MFIENLNGESRFVAPAHVAAVFPRRKGGSEIWLTSGGVVNSKMSVEETVETLGLND